MSLTSATKPGGQAPSQEIIPQLLSRLSSGFFNGAGQGGMQSSKGGSPMSAGGGGNMPSGKGSAAPAGPPAHGDRVQAMQQLMQGGGAMPQIGGSAQTSLNQPQGQGNSLAGAFLGNQANQPAPMPSIQAPQHPGLPDLGGNGGQQIDNGATGIPMPGQGTQPQMPPGFQRADTFPGFPDYNSGDPRFENVYRAPDGNIYNANTGVWSNRDETNPMAVSVGGEGGSRTMMGTTSPYVTMMQQMMSQPQQQVQQQPAKTQAQLLAEAINARAQGR